MNAYVKAFRRLVAEMKRIPGDGKFDSKGDGLAEWRTRVDSAKISTLTPSLVQEWKQEFVIESSGSVSRSPGSGSYRCQNHIDFLKAWLRDNGIVARKPIHELRKEVGSVIASEQGIFAASRYLRHSDIRITSAIYADQKKRVIPSIASRLSTSSMSE
jgi:hypothetical protein